ncbi:MAG: response regulator [Planctomycetota bacterium]|nr:MAG: response regulator [Planctomycetota bacterium]
MKPKILLVDDDDGFRASVCTCLTLEGYSVIEASDGIEALKVLYNQNIDLLITDILMPVMDGIGLSIKIRKKYPQLRTIGMTGGGRLGDSESVSKMSKPFFSSYLKKPFGTHELLEKIIALEKSDGIS